MGVGPGVRAALRRARDCRLLFAIIIVVALCSSFGVTPTSAEDWSAPRTVFVPETGHTADGLFLDVWRSERALLGDPVTEEFRPRSGFNAGTGVDVVQFYEHLALVYVPDASPEEQVQALDLGQQALEQAKAAGISRALGRAMERAVCPPGGASCMNVVASGHTVRGPFQTYWSNGNAAFWLGLPVTESFTAPDGTRVQYFQNGILRQTAADEVAPLPLGESAAHKAEIDTQPVTQPSDVPTYTEDLFVPPATPVTETAETDWSFGPGPQQGAWKEIVVSISAQRMWAYEGEELLVTSLVSTGTGNVPETVTPLGFFSVLAKFEVQTMEGTISEEYYRVEDVPNVMYFDDLGDALHGAYWHNNFGTPMSHGCVNLPLDIASWMYGWAPVGTAVTVIA